MNKRKVAPNKARHSKASVGSLAGDSNSATMRRGRNGAAAKAEAERMRRLRAPGDLPSEWPRPQKRELDHAVQRYADLYDLAPTGYVSFDRSGRIEEINLTAAQLFGMPRERLIGMPFMVFVLREDTELFLHHLLRCRCSDPRVDSELRLKDVKHKIIHAVISSTPVAASVLNGALLYQTSIVDLTERKQAQAQLQRAMDFDEAIMTNMGEGLYTVDTEGLVTMMNPAA